MTLLSETMTPPTWLDGEPRPDPHDLIAMGNGLLDVSTRTLHPHQPGFWVHHALPFDFDPNPPEPKRFWSFLSELWPDDAESVATLQEVLGYIVSGDTRLQKLFLLVGPKRSGKGTIGRLLAGLIGAHNRAAPTLSGLATNFGLTTLIGRSLAIISDARVSTRSDQSIAVERLLSISGEDALTVDIKHRAPWVGHLPTRFVICTNELPDLHDTSGALASRFIVLLLERSFYGKEDPTLTDHLLAELPGIFIWALKGLDRLRARGHFVQPSSAAEAVAMMQDLASPVGAFVREVCHVHPGVWVGVDALYQAWCQWCFREGTYRAGSKEWFGKELAATEPTVRKRRPRDDSGGRETIYSGITLRADASFGVIS